MEPMEPMEQPEGAFAEEVGDGAGGGGLVTLENGDAVGVLADVGGLVLEDEEGDGEDEEDGAAGPEEGVLEVGGGGDGGGEVFDDEAAEDADAQVGGGHGFAAAAFEPLGDDDLVGDGTGEDVADGVEGPHAVVEGEGAGHLTEADEGERC